ncbi:MAG: hypothetical protein GC181_06905 [Bacteroidetes bacterium]|nr:hypothetical protein [Bacteroidota bacterium]
MSERTARFISLIAHPVFVPTYAVLAIINWHFLVAATIRPEMRWIFATVFSMTLSVVPTIGVALMLKKYTISELSSMSREERISSSFVLGMLYLFVAFSFKTLFVADILKVFVIALGVSALVLSLISRLMKISFHAFSWAGMLVLMIAISTQAVHRMGWIVIATLLFGGLVAVARLRLNAHKHSEVYWGYIIGLICNTSVYLIFYGL